MTLFNRAFRAQAGNPTIIYLISCVVMLFSIHSYAAPIRDITNVYGDRTNQLIGYGLVVGLDGSGDKSQVKFTSQSVRNMVEQFGVQLGEKSNPKLKNVAAVSVIATVNSHAGTGQQLDITVASLGDAKSLRGGTLLLTQLKGVDGNVYAVAQGNVIVGGYNYTGADGSSITQNTPTAGRIPNGATLEREVYQETNADHVIKLQLKKPNYKTALNISKSINTTFGDGVAKAMSKGEVQVSGPKDTEDRVMFMSMIEMLDIDEGQEAPRIILNSRTGTVVMSSNVTVSEAAVSQGGITVTIQEDQYVSQPNSIGGFNQSGDTKVIQDSKLNIDQKTSNTMIWPAGTNLQEVVDAINRVGATPDELMSILQALDEVGALNGELVVI